MKKIILLLISFCFLFSSCINLELTRNGAPSWIEDTYDSNFLKKDYLCAVGTGITKEQAEKNAKSSLSQIFNTSVSVIMQESTFDDGTNTQSSFSSFDVMTSEVENMLGIEVVDIFNSENGEYWVRVALEKKQAVNNISNFIEADMDSIENLIQKANIVANSFEELRVLLQAKGLAEKVNNDLLRLSVLKGYSIKSPKIEIDKRIATLKSNLSVSINYNNEIEDLLKSSFEKTLETNGFNIKNNSIATLDVNSNNDITIHEDFYYCNMDLKVSFKSNDLVIWSYNFAVRGIGINEQSAKEKAIKKLILNFEKEFLNI